MLNANHNILHTIARRKPTAAPAPGAGLPQKGMTTGEMQALLGAAVDSSERKEGRLTVITRSYRSGASRVAAEFVEDVLIRYSITSE